MTTGTAAGSEPPEPDGQPPGRARRRGVHVTTAAAVALGLALAGGSVAGAATTSTTSTPSSHPDSSGSAPPPGRLPGGGSPPAAVGTVMSVDAGSSSFSVGTADGRTVTVKVSSSTRYLDRDVSDPSLADVTVGQHVAAFGTDVSDVVSATTVAIGAPPSGTPPTTANGKPGDSRPPPPAGAGSS